MSGLREFLEMGGYAFSVWTSYVITIVVLVANWVLPVHRGRRLRAELAKVARRKEEAAG